MPQKFAKPAQKLQRKVSDFTRIVNHKTFTHSNIKNNDIFRVGASYTYVASCFVLRLQRDIIFLFL